MKNYRFQLTPWPVENRLNVNDVLNQTIEHSILGTSLKDALRQLYKSSEFNKYIHVNTTVWVYWKSNFNGKLFLIPDYENVNI